MEATVQNNLEQIRVAIQREFIERCRKNPAASMPGFLSLSDDEFELLSEWHHFAIIELSKTDGFQFDPQKIGNRLGFHAEEVRDAIERLQRLNFIQVKEGMIKVLSPNTTWTNTKRLPEFKEKLKEMRQELAAFFQADDEKSLDEVYQLTVSFFPLTKIENKKQEKENE